MFAERNVTDSRTRVLESTKVCYIVAKFTELWFTNGFKPDRSFYPPSLWLFCPWPSHTLYAPLTWRPPATLNEMALGLSAAQTWSRKRC